MGNYFNDDEFEGVESVKISAKRNKGKKMVGGVPMATIYEGMSLHRYQTLAGLEQKAWDNVFWERYNADGTDRPNATDSAEFKAAHDAEFRRLCQQAAIKAGWHATRRAARQNHPSINKKKGK